jgi:hypothetical protein
MLAIAVDYGRMSDTAMWPTTVRSSMTGTFSPGL